MNTWRTETLPFDLDQWINSVLDELEQYLRLVWEFQVWEQEQA